MNFPLENITKIYLSKTNFLVMQATSKLCYFVRETHYLKYLKLMKFIEKSEQLKIEYDTID